jgi:hypothetical protein
VIRKPARPASRAESAVFRIMLQRRDIAEARELFDEGF